MQPDPVGIIEATGRAVGGGEIAAVVILALAAIAGAGITVWLLLRARPKAEAVTVELGPHTKDWAREEMRHHRANLAMLDPERKTRAE